MIVKPRVGRVMKGLERVFMVAGLLLVGAAAFAIFGEHLQQRQAAREFERIYATATRTPHVDTAEWARIETARTGIVGKMEIPSVGLSAIIVEGSGSKALYGGVGHMRGTAFPGEDGNVVLAGHRDTYFRPLKDIHPSDIIRVTTPGGVYLYSVSATSIVDPSRTEVLADTGSPVLTLVTCYPFYYVGHAPKRFVVQARQIEAQPFHAPRVVRLG